MIGPKSINPHRYANDYYRGTGLWRECGHASPYQIEGEGNCGPTELSAHVGKFMQNALRLSRWLGRVETA